MALIPFLTAKEIAAKLGVSRQRVHAIAANRHIYPIQRVGHTRVWAVSDLKRFTAKKKAGRPKKALTGVSTAA